MRKISVVSLLFCLLTAWCTGTIWGDDTSGRVDTPGIGAETRDEIAWRKEWVGRLGECDNYVADYIKNTPLPTYLVYSSELEKGEIDWNRETRALSFRIALYPDKN